MECLQAINLLRGLPWVINMHEAAQLMIFRKKSGRVWWVHHSLIRLILTNLENQSTVLNYHHKNVMQLESVLTLNLVHVEVVHIFAILMIVHKFKEAMMASELEILDQIWEIRMLVILD